MKIKWKTLKNEIPDTIKSIQTINNKKVQVGIFDGEQAWLASIHEYGCNIKAKKSKYLTIPIHPKAKNKKASDFADIFYYQAKTGNKFLAVPNGKSIELLYWLTPEVHIPERSFLRNGHDECINEVMKRAEILINGLLNKSIKGEQILDLIGQRLATSIKSYAVNLSNPPNSSITTNVKGSSNPLSDTGSMINSITWRVKE